VEEWKPWHIPIKIGLIDSSGQDMVCSLENERMAKRNHILELKDKKETFRFVDVKEKTCAVDFKTVFCAGEITNATSSR
jgi:aminopeptidase N